MQISNTMTTLRPRPYTDAPPSLRPLPATAQDVAEHMPLMQRLASLRPRPHTDAPPSLRPVFATPQPATVHDVAEHMPLVQRLASLRPAPATPRPATAQDLAEHMPLVQRLASRFMRRLPRSVQRDDLVAAGTLGLFHALRSTSHTTPAMFTAYASVRIYGAMIDELRRHDWSPRRRKAPLANDGTDVARDAARAKASLPPIRACVAVVGFDDLPVGAVAALAEDGLSPLEDALVKRERDALHAAVRQLPEREREIVCMRYFDGIPSKVIAQSLGLSEARVSQLHARAMGRLKELLLETSVPVKLAA